MFDNFELFYVLICLIGGIVTGWLMFEKMGEPGWKILIPFYNYYTYLKHTYRSPLLMLFLTIIPVAGLFVVVINLYRLSKAFGYGVLFTILWLFIPFAAQAIIAFGSAEYNQEHEHRYF